MNPLAELHKTISYAKLSDIVGLHKNTLRRIGEMNGEELKGVNLGTYVLLKEKLDIDLANNIK